MAPTTVDGSGWDRRRLLVILAAAAAAAVVALIGLAYAVAQVVTIGDSRTSAAPASADAEADADESVAGSRAVRRDEIAASPMLGVPASAMSPGVGVIVDEQPKIHLPTYAVPGPASVLTGYPRTALGAVGQLAQIETTVLQAMSLTAAYDVHQAWALPGGVGEKEWSLTRSVGAFLSAAGMRGAKDPSTTVTSTPVGAMVKGTDGRDWVVACVLMKVAAVYRETAEVAFGNCERMQWVGGRWMLAPGTPPAAAPSTWPGTALAHEAGWQGWVGDIGGDRR